MSQPELTSEKKPGQTNGNTPPKTPGTKSDKQDAFFPNLLVNIVLPVLILNKLDKWFPVGPWVTLAIALAFPLSYAVKDIATKRKVGALSALGALNVLGTGGLAALGLGGIWFAVKEAFFPFVIGVGVIVTAFRKTPAAELLFLTDAIFNTDAVRSSIAAHKRETEFHHSMRVATFALAGSFFLSAALNFGLAIYVFEPIATTLSEAERTQALNHQVARMTWMGFVVIALPSFLCTAAVFWNMVKSIRRHTGLSDSEIFRT